MGRAQLALLFELLSLLLAYVSGLLLLRGAQDLLIGE